MVVGGVAGLAVGAAFEYGYQEWHQNLRLQRSVSRQYNAFKGAIGLGGPTHSAAAAALPASAAAPAAKHN